MLRSLYTFYKQMSAGVEETPMAGSPQGNTLPGVLLTQGHPLWEPEHWSEIDRISVPSSRSKYTKIKDTLNAGLSGNDEVFKNLRNAGPQ